MRKILIIIFFIIIFPESVFAKNSIFYCTKELIKRVDFNNNNSDILYKNNLPISIDGLYFDFEKNELYFSEIYTKNKEGEIIDFLSESYEHKETDYYEIIVKKINLNTKKTTNILSIKDETGEDNIFPVYKFKNFIIFEKIEVECNYFKLFDVITGKFIHDLNNCYNAHYYSIFYRGNTAIFEKTKKIIFDDKFKIEKIKEDEYLESIKKSVNYFDIFNGINGVRKILEKYPKDNWGNYFTASSVSKNYIGYLTFYYKTSKKGYEHGYYPDCLTIIDKKDFEIITNLRLEDIAALRDQPFIIIDK